MMMPCNDYKIMQVADTCRDVIDYKKQSKNKLIQSYANIYEKKNICHFQNLFIENIK